MRFIRKSVHNHRLELTFDGGSEKFRYFSVIDYMRDKGVFDNTSEDNATIPILLTLV